MVRRTGAVAMISHFMISRKQEVKYSLTHVRREMRCSGSTSFFKEESTMEKTGVDATSLIRPFPPLLRFQLLQVFHLPQHPPKNLTFVTALIC